jgi:hypothetical protein
MTRKASGQVAEWLKAADCKSARVAYAGSNPALSTILSRAASKKGHRAKRRPIRIFVAGSGEASASSLDPNSTSIKCGQLSGTTSNSGNGGKAFRPTVSGSDAPTRIGRKAILRLLRERYQCSGQSKVGRNQGRQPSWNIRLEPTTAEPTRHTHRWPFGSTFA